ncbi:MAG: S24/S26 family peptidase [Acidobacteriota bacterium]
MNNQKMPDVQFADLAAEVLRRSLSCRFKAEGSSMLPFLRSGDVLTVAPVSADALRPGDVVFYQTDQGRPFVHRILKVRPRLKDDFWFEVRGDAHNGPCDRISATCVLGRVSRAERAQRVFFPSSGWRRAAARLWSLAGAITVPALRVALLVRRGASRAVRSLTHVH